MSDFVVRSDNVDVEQIMRQIRARIREKRGVDYTEEEIRELANVKLEKFIDPKGVRSNLLEEYRRVSTPEPPAPNFAFGEDTLYETHRGPIRWLRALFRPLLKLLFNPNPLIQALHIQSELNQKAAARNARRDQLDALHYEVIHNLVVELTRTGVEVKSLKMRLESMASRLDFDERRARALEGVVQYRPGAVPPLQVPGGQEQGRRDQRPRRDQGPRDRGGRDQGPREQGPREQGAREQGPRDQGPREHGPRDQGPRDQAPREQPAREQAPREPGAGNALDNDGNERRARRRRRRGRRRPGEERGPALAGGGPNASFGAASPEDRSPTSEERSATSEDRIATPEDRAARSEDRGQDSVGGSASSSHAADQTPDRTSDLGQRTSDSGNKSGAADTPPRDLPSE